MKRLALAFALALAFGYAHAQSTIGPPNAVFCNAVANVAVGTTSPTAIVTGVATQSVFICGYEVTNTGATGTYTFTYGTGASCASPTTLVAVHSVTVSAPIVHSNDVAQMQTASGASLCVTPSVNTIATTVWYSQF